MPSPPFPDPGSPILRLIVARAAEGSDPARQPWNRRSCTQPCTAGMKVTHVQGEGACPGCSYRGDLRKQTSKGWVDPRVPIRPAPNPFCAGSVSPRDQEMAEDASV
jgi:hypothetical protein